MSWAALALAVLGAGCLSTGLATALGFVFGAAQLASILALSEVADHSPARVPVMLVAGVLAGSNVLALRRDPRLGGRSRRGLYAAAAAVLALIAVEIALHFRNDGVFW